MQPATLVVAFTTIRRVYSPLAEDSGTHSLRWSTHPAPGAPSQTLTSVDATSSRSTNPESGATSATKNVSILGGSYNLNVYPPYQVGSPNLTGTHKAWDQGAAITTDSNNAAVIPTGGNLQDGFPTQPPVLTVSDELLGKHLECSRFTAHDSSVMSRHWILRNRRLQGFFPRPTCCCKEAAPRFRYPCRARGFHPAAIGRPSERDTLLLPGIASKFFIHCHRALPGFISRRNCEA